MDFLRYHGFCALHHQDQLHSRFAEIAYAMQRFVNSKKVCLLIDPRTRLRRCPVKEALRPIHAYLSNSNGHNRTRDALQMYSLGTTGYGAGILNWRFPEADGDVFAKARGSLSSLRKLGVRTSVNEDQI
ncbi:hypothetical protein N7G274_008681 [Stereocaulon virgatum]|uniref:Uncharacterized protein n=1 Tax=Stereocaulon virgatum TaxID=373712 RepID=A0ABR4A5K4_9LECA